MHAGIRHPPGAESSLHDMGFNCSLTQAQTPLTPSVDGYCCGQVQKVLLGPWSSLNLFCKKFFVEFIKSDENYEKTRLVLIFASDWLIMEDIYLQSHPSKSCFSSLSCRRDSLYHDFTRQKITINSPNSGGIDFCSVHIRDRLPLPFMIFWNKDWFVLTWVDVKFLFESIWFNHLNLRYVQSLHFKGKMSL